MPSVKLSDIQSVSSSELRQSRLDNLLNGYSSFDQVLSNSSDPIALSKKGGAPYDIIDGRHRVYLARKKGYNSVDVVFI